MPDDEALVEKRLARLTALVGGAKSGERGLQVGRLGHDVGAETAESLRPAARHLEHGAVPEDRLALAASEDEPGRPERARVRSLNAPAPARAQVAPEGQPALEAQEEVLPHRLDALEAAPVEPGRDPEHRGARMRRLDRDDLPLERPQPLGRAVEGVALRHGARPAAGRPGSPPRGAGA